MDSEIQKRTVLEKIKSKVRIRGTDVDICYILISERDFGPELDLDFKGLGKLILELEKDNVGRLQIEMVDRVGFKPEDYILGGESISVDAAIETRAVYRIKTVNLVEQKRGDDVSTSNIQIGEEKGSVYILVPNQKAIKIGKITTRKSKLCQVMFNHGIDTAKSIDSVIDSIRLPKDSGDNSDVEGWEEIIRTQFYEIKKIIDKRSSFPFDFKLEMSNHQVRMRAVRKSQ